MNESDIEVEAYGVEAMPGGLRLYVRDPSGEFHPLTMPRELAGRMAAEIAATLGQRGERIFWRVE